jgi:putative flavoprotein involved in K+ transport
MYVLGTPLLRRRRSTYINGASADTEELAKHMHAFLGARATQTPSRSPCPTR